MNFILAIFLIIACMHVADAKLINKYERLVNWFWPEEHHVWSRFNDHICPDNSQSCINDEEGYLSFKVLFALLDVNKDGQVSGFEAREILEIGNDRLLNGIMGKNYDEKMGINELWENWVKSDEYKWVNIELSKYLLGRGVNGLVLKETTGKMIPILINLNNYYLENVLGANIPHEIDLIRKELVQKIVFGDVYVSPFDLIAKECIQNIAIIYFFAGAILVNWIISLSIGYYSKDYNSKYTSK